LRIELASIAIQQCEHALLTSQHYQESLSRAYLLAIAGRAGFSCSVRNLDYGIDVTLHEVVKLTSELTGRTRYVESGVCLDIQVKSTTRAIVDDECIRYDIAVEAYEVLRTEHVVVPRILVLHVQPVGDAVQLLQTEAALQLGGCCYWMSLKGAPEVVNKRTERISVPRGNVFSAEMLQAFVNQHRPLRGPQ
jgi:hypothetical protein